MRRAAQPQALVSPDAPREAAHHREIAPVPASHPLAPPDLVRDHHAVPLTMNTEAGKALKALLTDLEGQLTADLVTIVGEIRAGLDDVLRSALEPLKDRRTKLAVILHTGGGIVEVAERMVHVMRHFYQEVVFIVPNVAMSAGTVLVISGDAIMMDFFSSLGPIDPQVEREGKLVPALSYLIQWDRFVRKSQNQTLTDAEFLIMQGMDLAELHKFEMARDLSISLLKQWLAKYKFKDWKKTETRGLPGDARCANVELRRSQADS